MTTGPAAMQLPQVPPATVFISHSSKDHAVVQWLEAQVKAAGHTPWVAEWDPRPGARLTDKVLGQLRASDAYVLLLTEDGYDSVYVQQEAGAAVTSGKPVIALVDQELGDRPLGMLADIEQVRFDRNNLAESTAAITTGLVSLARRHGVSMDPEMIVLPSQPTMFAVSVDMKLQFQVTPGQVLVGVCGLLLIVGFLYLISREGGSFGS